MKITSKYVIEKVVIKTKSTESRNRLFKLIVDGLKMKKMTKKERSNHISDAIQKYVSDVEKGKVSKGKADADYA